MNINKINYRPTEGSIAKAAKAVYQGELTNQTLQSILEEEVKGLFRDARKPIQELVEVLTEKIQPIFLDELATAILNNGKIIEE